MDDETEHLIQRWVLAFCEIPIVVDPDLMRAVLAEVDAKGRNAPD